MIVYLVMDAEQVRSLRKQKGMSQRRLAEVSGDSRKTLVNTETGRTYTFPQTARKMAAASSIEEDPDSFATVALRA